MFTQEWLNTRVARAAARIRRDTAQGKLDVCTLMDAMAEITGQGNFFHPGSAPDESDVRVLAQALGCLRADEYRYVLREVGNLLWSEAEGSMGRALDVLKTKATDESPDGLRDISAIRLAEPVHTVGLLRWAMLLQALVWAVIPPPVP